MTPIDGYCLVLIALLALAVHWGLRLCVRLAQAKSALAAERQRVTQLRQDISQSVLKMQTLYQTMRQEARN